MHNSVILLKYTLVEEITNEEFLHLMFHLDLVEVYMIHLQINTVYGSLST